MKKLFFLLIAFFTSAISFAQTTINNDVLQKLRSSVFEVVIDKIEDTNITYEKPLPLDRIPFKLRNDKFTPIGTAFILEDGTFLSASHVINLFGDSIYKDYYLRDEEGKTYKIEQINSFSNNRDYISFTVPSYKQKQGQGLKINENFQLNTNIFSVGNALGEGIIIRNGLLTSQTYEDLNGEWQWLRFSAAASPGNSGGPLVNESGEVIGIITMKSQNENLNYALPISEIYKDPKNTGIINTPMYYSLPNITNKKQYVKFEYKASLPKSYSELHKELTNEFKSLLVKTVEDMKKEYSLEGTKGLVNSKELDELAFYTYNSSFPYIIYLNNNGKWDFGGGNTQTYALDKNGIFEYTSILGLVLANITKPEDIPLKDFLANPKYYVDYYITADSLTRNVAGEDIPMTSLGKPSRSEKYVDFFGRTWLVNYFNIDFADSTLLTFALPTPKGAFVMYRIDSTSNITSCNYLDMQFISDNYYSPIIGTVKEFTDFLNLPESLVGKKPSYLQNISLTKDKKQFIIDTSIVTLTLNDKIFKITDDTNILIPLGLSKTNENKIVLNDRGIIVFGNSKEKDYHYINLVKFTKPGANATKQTEETWNQFITRVSPFDGKPYNNDNFTYKDLVLLPEGQDNKNPDSVYIFYTELKEQGRFKDIDTFANNVLQKTTLK